MNQKLPRFAFANDDEAARMIRPSSERVTPSPGNNVLRELREARIARETPVSPARDEPENWRPAESPNGCSNLPNTFDLQGKTIAPAIDYMGPDGLNQENPTPGMKVLLELRAKRRQALQEAGYANLSPGQKILYELRARRGGRSRGYGFANATPEGSGGESDGISLTPRQQVDVHALAQNLAKRGGEATVNMITPSGKWREQPPHEESGGHPHRAAEAVANAVASGAMQAHPIKTKLGRVVYIPGPAFGQFNRPMEDAPGRTGQSSVQWKGPTKPPSPESAQFIQKAALHPRQLADIQTLVQMMQNEGGRLSAGRIDQLRGKWRTNPPHVENADYANRHEEARGLAMKHGAFAADPQSEKFIPGPNYVHFLAPGQTPVGAKLLPRDPRARRSAAERSKDPTMPSRKTKTGSPTDKTEPMPKNASDKIWANDRQVVKSLIRGFNEEAEKRGVKIPEDFDWNEHLSRAVRLPGYTSRKPFGLNDRTDVLSAAGAKMIDAIRNYDEASDGPFAEWAKVTMDHAGRTATDELRAANAGQGRRKGKRGANDEDSEGNPITERVSPPEISDEERTITPEIAVKVLRNREKWNDPKFVKVREAVTDRFGPETGEIFRDLLLGRISHATLESNKQWPTIRDQIVKTIAGHLETGNPEDETGMDTIETVLGTERMKQNPLKMSNQRSTDRP